MSIGRVAIAVMLASVAGVSLSAQMKGVQAQREVARVDYIKSPTRPEGSVLVTKLQVKNMSSAPIPRLTVAEIGYDASGAAIPGGKATVNGLLQPGEVTTLEIRTPPNPSVKTTKLMFSHASGAVTAHAVKSFDAKAKKK